MTRHREIRREKGPRAKIESSEPTTESALNDGSVQGFIFREPSTAAIQIALLPRPTGNPFFPAPPPFLRSGKLRKFRRLTASLTYTETGSNGLHAWHAVRVACTLFLGWKSSRKSAVRSLS